MSETITVYGRTGCAQCENTMRALSIAAVPTRYVDLDVDAAAADELRALGVQQLPYVRAANGDSWSGLRLDKIVEQRQALLTSSCCA